MLLIHLLNYVYARTTNPFEDVTFLKTAQDPEVAAQCVSIVDIFAKMLKKISLFEMQIGKEQGFEKRAQYYAAKTYIQQREKERSIRI